MTCSLIWQEQAQLLSIISCTALVLVLIIKPSHLTSPKHNLVNWHDKVTLKRWSSGFFPGILHVACAWEEWKKLECQSHPLWHSWVANTVYQCLLLSWVHREVYVFLQFPTDLWRNFYACSSVEKICCWSYCICICLGTLLSWHVLLEHMKSCRANGYTSSYEHGAIFLFSDFVYV